jgi:hypothetical protein
MAVPAWAFSFGSEDEILNGVLLFCLRELPGYRCRYRRSTPWDEEEGRTG